MSVRAVLHEAPHADITFETTMEDGDSLGLIRDWHRTLRARDLASKTRHYYWLGMSGLMEFHDFEVHPLDITESHIAAYLASIGDRSAHKALMSKGIVSFYKWATRRGFLLMNPMTEDITPRRTEAPPPERFEMEELTRLLIAAWWRDQRRACAIHACVSLGTRRAELCNLKLSDIDWSRGVVRVLGKGRRYREIDIGGWAAEALRELERSSDGTWLIPRFAGKGGGPIAPNTFGDWVRDAARDCGFPEGRKQRSHTLRATFISMLMDANKPVHVVQKLAGHRSVKTTSGYMAVGQVRSTRDAVSVMGGVARLPDEA
jgi:integrase/recombinase XerC